MWLLQLSKFKDSSLGDMTVSEVSEPSVSLKWFTGSMQVGFQASLGIGLGHCARIDFSFQYCLKEVGWETFLWSHPCYKST